MARFDRVILPGEEGKIRLRIDTRHYYGGVTKKAKVYTNDPRKRQETLTIKAFIKVAIHLSTRRVEFYGREGQTITKAVKISAKEEKPLKLEPNHFNLAEKVTYRIEEIEPGRVFNIYFTNVPGPAETYRGVLKLKTNYPEKPEISISIRARLKKEDAKKAIDKEKN